jgi:hypothetical protein
MKNGIMIMAGCLQMTLGYEGWLIFTILLHCSITVTTAATSNAWLCDASQPIVLSPSYTVHFSFSLQKKGCHLNDRVVVIYGCFQTYFQCWQVSIASEGQ